MSTYLDIAKQVEARLSTARVVDLGQALAPPVALERAGSADVVPQCSLPETVPSYRQWVTGSIPGTASRPMGKPLPAPTCRTTRHTPVTYWGKLCPTKACQKRHLGATRSQRFFPTGLCVSCWERAEKRTTVKEPAAEECHDGRMDAV